MEALDVRPALGDRASAVNNRRRLLGPDLHARPQWSVTAYWPHRRNSGQAVQSCAIFSGTQMCGTIVKPSFTKCDGSWVKAQSVEKPRAAAPLESSLMR